MPNWVTTEIKTSPEVIRSMVNGNGNIDFSTVLPFPGEFEWGGVYGDAETAAEAVLRNPLSDHPLIASLEAANRSQADIAKLSDESFEQFIQMLRNHRKCGFLHQMDFAREKWGSKWNACDSTHNAEDGTARFDTAWSCPEPLLIEVSKKFPDTTIEVMFADEDIGSNCGRFSLKNGVIISSDIAPSWNDMDEQARKKWSDFARKVKGWTDEENDDSE
ncbi:hypothetical protein [Pusillimonas sp. NJUB218]|uniref:DUF1281 family ferredoxin-like fold protein n=1 Tax=Pusillimonas sp. NJUB218 TaxID=2023230 RepID=UPI000F4C7366|nr:hypothetical protein [Pusillimonas sp. NJUB218]ROT45037.1 hypothetical protein CHR62_09305 [Pusillimonas sp. NJUB218]